MIDSSFKSPSKTVSSSVNIEIRNTLYIFISGMVKKNSPILGGIKYQEKTLNYYILIFI